MLADFGSMGGEKQQQEPETKVQGRANVAQSAPKRILDFNYIKIKGVKLIKSEDKNITVLKREKQWKRLVHFCLK